MTETQELYDQAMERANFPEDLSSPAAYRAVALADVRVVPELLTADLTDETLAQAEDVLLGAVVSLQQARRALKAKDEPEEGTPPADGQPVVPQPDYVDDPEGGEPTVPEPDYGDEPDPEGLLGDDEKS